MSAAEIIAELSRLNSTELAAVHAKLEELARPRSAPQSAAIESHPALGIWKDRKDLPADSLETSKLLRQRMMQRSNDSAE